MDWIDAAARLSRVRIPAGTHRLAVPLRVDRDLVLEGAGPGRTILLSDVAADPVLVVAGGRVVLRNLSIRRGRGSGDLVDVNGGSLSGEGLEVEGATLDPGGAAGGAGLRASGSGRLRLKECRIRSCEYAGLVAQDDGLVEAKGCRIESCGSGVLGWGRARVRLEDCRLEGMAEFGLGVNGTQRAAIRGCTVLGGRMGLVFSQSARGRVERCRVEETGQVGIFVRNSARVDVNGCTVAGNRGIGICYGTGSKGRAAGNSMIGNAQGAVYLEAGAQAVIGVNRIEEAKVVRIGGG